MGARRRVVVAPQNVRKDGGTHRDATAARSTRL